VLDEAAARLNAHLAVPAIAYMRRELTAGKPGDCGLQQRQDRRARVYRNGPAEGRVEDAREYFIWVRDYGDRRFVECTLAVAELSRDSGVSSRD
jgi:hypothetical protein